MKRSVKTNKVLIILVMLPVLFSFLLISCNPKNEETTQYFKNFLSTPPYTVAVEKLRLEKGVTIAQYDAVSGFFLTQKNYIDDDADVRLGFCTATKDLISPMFKNVLDIRGNYAVVTLSFASGDTIENRVGVVKIPRDGSNAVISKNYGFSYAYIPTITQYTMINDNYIIVMGSKDSEESNYDEAIVYDYTSTNGLLEVAKIEGISNLTKFYCAEDYMIAQSPGIARVYNLTSIDSQGYLALKSYYIPFDESDGYSSSMVEVEPYYLGNHWFIFTGIYSSPEEYDNYELIKVPENNDTQYYMTLRSKRYNALTGQYYDTDRVSLVANKYTSLLIKDIANIMNTSNSEIYINAEEGGDINLLQKLYSSPVFPTSEIIKDGYSIVYSYFPIYSSDSTYSFADTFQIYDSNAERIAVPEALMPLLFIDGKGLQNIDPNFSLPGRDVGYHSYLDNKRVAIKAVSDRIVYDPYIIHSDIIIAMEFNLDKPSVNRSAAFSTAGSQITPFDYDIITPFFGEYAIAGKNEKVDSNDFFKYYRIDKAGNVSDIDKYVYSVHNGVYVVKENDKFSLYANSGKKLLSADSSFISVMDTFFVDGYVFKSYVITVENGCGVIYELN